VTPEKRAPLGRLIASVLVAATAVPGILNFSGELSQAATAGQKLTTCCKLGYAVAGLAALAALWARPARARPLLLLWGALLTATASSAAIAWGHAGSGAAATGGVAVAAFSALVLRLALGRWRARPSEPGRAAGGEISGGPGGIS
jgi:hypothetical protein